MRPSCAPRAALLAFALGCLVVTKPARAESAADKATAREAATQGIELYKAGKYDEALDRLKRAQALYDAPVHLLYIARSQAKLAQLVEAAENYRLLDHYTLPANAPEAWTSAVDDGRKELAELEPRIPQLRVVVEPKDAPGQTLEIDDAAVSAAVIGIARPINPGKHHVKVSAQGFAPAETDAELAEKDSKDVSLKLTPGASPPPPIATPADSASKASTDSSNFSPVGFLLGVRLGAGVPTGTLFHLHTASGSVNRDLQTSDAFETGGAGELHFGLRIARYFTPVLYLEGESPSPGNGFAGLQGIKSTSAGSFGLGLIAGSAPNRLGGFGELDIAFINTFSLTAKNPVTTRDDCKASATGGALRFGGGAVLPVSTWLHVTPVVMATIGRFTSIDAGCLTGSTDRTIATADQRTHGMIFIGIGGDAVLGNDRR
jgi:hypothetical protein